MVSCRKPWSFILCCVTLFFSITALSGEQSAKPAKPQSISPTEEKRLIALAEQLPTADGASVLQVIRYAQKIRPTKFKLAGFSIFYDGKGVPDTVGVCYWVGAKRLEGDEYCDVAFSISSDKKSVTPDYVTDEPHLRPQLTLTKLMLGRDAFVKKVDENYNNDCIDDASKQKNC